jgi:hypothetical protein
MTTWRLALCLAIAALAACSSGSGAADGGGAADAGGAAGADGARSDGAAIVADAGGAVDAAVDAAVSSDGGPAVDVAADLRAQDGPGDALPLACGDAVCGASELCVTEQTIGGAVFVPGDGGVCPPPRIIVPDAPTSCSLPPSFHCSLLPAGCTNPCSCAQAICRGSECSQPAPGSVRCVLLAP